MTPRVLAPQQVCGRAILPPRPRAHLRRLALVLKLLIVLHLLALSLLAVHLDLNSLAISRPGWRASLPLLYGSKGRVGSHP